MAIAIVQHIGSSSSANSDSVTGTITASAAGSVIIVGSGNGSGRTVLAVTDNKGNTYTQANGSVTNAGSTSEVDQWYCLAPASGVTGVTIQYSGGAGTFNKDIFVWEVSGFVSPIFDITSIRINDSGSSNTYNGPLAEPINQPGIAVAVVVAATTIDQNPKTGNAFTSGGDIAPSGTAGCSLILSNTNALNPQWHGVGAANATSSALGIYCEAPTPIANAVLFDAATVSSAVAASSSLTWNHIVGSASNRFIIVGVSIGASNDAGITIAVTCGGNSMTSIGLVHANASNQGYTQLFKLLAPSSGSNSIAVTLSGGTASIEAGAVSFSNVDQSTPHDTLQSATGASTTPSVGVTSQVGDMVIDSLATGSGVLSSTQTMRWAYNQNTATQGGAGAGSIANGSAGTVTMSYSVTADSWGILGLNINAAPAAGGDIITRGPDQWQILIN